MRKPLFLNALVAAVLFIACSPEEQPYCPDMAPSTDLPATEVGLPFPEGELTIDLDFNNEDKVTQTWWGKLVYEYMSDAEIDANSSRGGSTVVSQPRSGYVSGYPALVWDCGMVDRVYDFNTPDIIFIHGGTNDNTLKSELGTIQCDLPIWEVDDFKFRSAYASMVRKLMDYYSDAQLILIIGNSLSEPYAQAIINVAEHYDLPYVSFIGDEIQACASDASGIHPNPVGHAFMAQKIYESCKEYLQ